MSPQPPTRPGRNDGNYATGFWLLAEAPRIFPKTQARPPALLLLRRKAPPVSDLPRAA
jgi:hypothetical protein